MLNIRLASNPCMSINVCTLSYNSFTFSLLKPLALPTDIASACRRKTSGRRFMNALPVHTVCFIRIVELMYQTVGFSIRYLLGMPIIMFSNSKRCFTSYSSNSCRSVHGRPKHFIGSFAIVFVLSGWLQ